MGLGKSLVKMAVGGLIINKIVKKSQRGNCGYCGRNFESRKGGQCVKEGCNKELCNKCLKKCWICGKRFCPDHINNHKCKK